MPDHSLQPIEEFLMTMKTVGYKRTIAALQNARQTGDPMQLHIVFIKELICDAFNLQFEKIVEERGYQNDMAYAKGFIIFYLRKNFGIKWIEIKMLLHRDQSVLSRTAKLIKQLDNRLQHHKPYCEKMNFFNDKIKLYLKQLKK